MVDGGHEMVDCMVDCGWVTLLVTYKTTSNKGESVEHRREVRYM